MQLRSVVVLLAACGAAPGVAHAPPPSAPTEPAPDAAEACRKLAPETAANALGTLPRPAPQLTANDVDGTRVDLRALRGRVVLVAFESSWASPSQRELPTLAALARAVGNDVGIVRVDSDVTIADASRDASPGYANIFDPQQGACSPIGRLTHTWGVDALPESFLIDRAGNLRFHFGNERDWGSADAIACVRALARDALPAMMSTPPDAHPIASPCEDAPQDSAVGGAQVSGMVSFPSNVDGLAPGTPIFIVAKSVRGGPPIAVTRVVYKGGDVPFTLDSSTVMIDGQQLAGEVVITARYDQDGDALTKQPGDRVGTVRVTVPAHGVKVVLDQTVQ